MLKFDIPVKPELDADFVPAVLWNRAYRAKAAAEKDSRRLLISLERNEDSITRFENVILAAKPEYFKLNLYYLERIIKFLLWSKGGWRVSVAGADELIPELNKLYCPGGRNDFDYGLMGQRYYGHDFVIRALPYDEIPEEKVRSLRTGGHWEGCRIGFDLGGSDRKCAAVIDGKCVYSEEVPWSPYFEKDYHYHLEGIRDSLRLAAAHLPRVDAIGGSSAGVFVDSCPRHSSLFRGLSEEDYKYHVHTLFTEAAKEFGDIPMQVLNDGEVTALAGALSWNKKALLGIAMGTSQAVGYVDKNGSLTDNLNELAFAPVDYRQENSPMDEWSKDVGVGAMYFSQQAVGRLAPGAGFDFKDMPLPEQLKMVQKAMEQDDPRAAAIYRTIGVFFAYALAHYSEFYDIENLLILGRVSSGKGGEIIIETAKKYLAELFPELSISFSVPDEVFKRHGQAVIAASLPEVKK